MNKQQDCINLNKTKKHLIKDLKELEQGFFRRKHRKNQAMQLGKNLSAIEIKKDVAYEQATAKLINHLYQMRQQLDIEDKKLDKTANRFVFLKFWQKSTIGATITLREIVTAGIASIEQYAAQSEQLQSALQSVRDQYVNNDPLGQPMLGPGMSR